MISCLMNIKLQYSTNSHGSEGEVGCLKAIRMLQYSANSHGSEGIDIQSRPEDVLQHSTFSDGSEGDYPTIIAVV